MRATHTSTHTLSHTHLVLVMPAGAPSTATRAMRVRMCPVPHAFSAICVHVVHPHALDPAQSHTRPTLDTVGYSTPPRPPPRIPSGRQVCTSLQFHHGDASYGHVPPKQPPVCKISSFAPKQHFSSLPNALPRARAAYYRVLVIELGFLVSHAETWP